MPRRVPTDIEKELYASDDKLNDYDVDLKETGSLIGGAVEAGRLAEIRITKAKAAIRDDTTLVRQRAKEVKALKTRIAHLHTMKRSRRKTLCEQHYRTHVNPLRKELGMPPLTTRTERK
tara:strand:- start:601 stop:957 length:357 start_codon:yes stop_codon:yes gene_type:complete